MVSRDESHSDQRGWNMSLQNITELDVVSSIKASLDNFPSPPVRAPFVSEVHQEEESDS